MQVNQKTSTNKSTDTSEILKKIDAILEEKKLQWASISLLKTKILHILHEESPKDHKATALKYIAEIDVHLYDILPDALKQDREIALLALQRWLPLSYISAKLQQEHDIIEQAYDHMMGSSVSLFELTDFLKVYKKHKKLTETLKNKLHESIVQKRLTLSELEEVLYEIFLKNKKLYEAIQSSKIFSWQSGKIWLRKEILKDILTLQWESQEHIVWNDKTALSEVLKKYFLTLFPDIPKELEQLIAVLLPQVQRFLKAKKETPDNKTWDETAGQRDEKDVWIGKYTKPSYTWDDGDDISHTTYLSEYRTWSSSGISTLQDANGFIIQIQTEKLASMNQISLENYIRFSKLLADLQLDFFLKKHASKMMLATEVDFYADQGMTDAKIFRFLSSIGKNIGIPEQSFASEEDGEKKVGCFANLESAKKHFRDIASSWYIVGNHICSPADRGDHAIVEIALKLKGIIVPPYWELSLAKWK